MNRIGLGTYALTGGVAVTLLAGCGDLQLPHAMPAAMQQSTPITTHYKKQSKIFKYTGSKQTFEVPSGREMDYRRCFRCRRGRTQWWQGRARACDDSSHGGREIHRFRWRSGFGTQGGFNGGGRGGAEHNSDAYGGGGASAADYGFGGGGGGGGSSYIESDAKDVRWQGWKNASGNGVIVISWQ